LESDSLRLCRSTKPQSCTEGRAYEEDLARSRKVEQFTTELIQKQGPTANEALAVLLCCYLGEGNGEDVLFAVTARGRQMLPLLRRYEHAMPVVPERFYPDNLRLPLETKERIFKLGIDSVLHNCDLTPTD
jgi:hypothetical protein